MTKTIWIPALIAFTIGSVYWSGGFDLVTDSEKLREFLQALGWLGPVLFVALFVVLQAMFVPAFVFSAAASYVWGFWVAWLLTWMGACGAGLLGFVFARSVGREWVQRHLPARFHRFDERLAERPLRGVMLIRLFFFVAPPADWVLGLSRVRLGPFVIGTLIGMLPGTAALTFVSGAGFEWLRAQPLQIWMVLGLLGAAGAGALHYRRQQRESAAIQPL